MKHLLAPEYFYNYVERWSTYLIIISSTLLLYGLFTGLVIAPIDYQQKAAVKIMYIHVPCAILSLAIYTIIGINSIIYLIWRIKLADILAAASAPLGISFTLLALISGALWGKPMWGTWWVWDARLTSELVLFFLYAGYMGLRSALVGKEVAAFSCAVLAVVGLIDVPIIHFSVNWWHTLHQGASLSRVGRPLIDIAILQPLLWVIIALSILYVALLGMNARNQILWQERHSSWVKRMMKGW